MSKENVQDITEFVLGKQIADWLDKELPGAITKAMQNVGSAVATNRVSPIRPAIWCATTAAYGLP